MISIICINISGYFVHLLLLYLLCFKIILHVNLSFTGKKTCLHIHGVFPYIYIPYEGCGSHDKLMYQIASSLDKALNISLGKANSATQHVYKVVLVSGL